MAEVVSTLALNGTDPNSLTGINTLIDTVYDNLPPAAVLSKAHCNLQISLTENSYTGDMKDANKNDLKTQVTNFLAGLKQIACSGTCIIKMEY